jgi:hypothetical protein
MNAQALADLKELITIPRNCGWFSRQNFPVEESYSLN